jgi:ribosomal protein S14
MLPELPEARLTRQSPMCQHCGRDLRLFRSSLYPFSGRSGISLFGAFGDKARTPSSRALGTNARRCECAGSPPLRAMRVTRTSAFGTASLDNFSSDMMGMPSQEDLRRERENIQKQLFPQAKPGEIWA